MNAATEVRALTLVLMNTALMREDLGRTTVKGNSGEEALQALNADPAIDLVITDHATPRMTGSPPAVKIWELAPDMHVVLATGYAELPEGGDATLVRLSKPFTQAQLAAALAEP